MMPCSIAQLAWAKYQSVSLASQKYRSLPEGLPSLARQRKVTAWAFVRMSPGWNCPSVAVETMPLSKAQSTGA